MRVQSDCKENNTWNIKRQAQMAASQTPFPKLNVRPGPVHHPLPAWAGIFTELLQIGKPSQPLQPKRATGPNSQERPVAVKPRRVLSFSVTDTDTEHAQHMNLRLGPKCRHWRDVQRAPIPSPEASSRARGPPEP